MCEPLPVWLCLCGSVFWCSTLCACVFMWTDNRLWAALKSLSFDDRTVTPLTVLLGISTKKMKNNFLELWRRGWSVWFTSIQTKWRTASLVMVVASLYYQFFGTYYALTSGSKQLIWINSKTTRLSIITLIMHYISNKHIVVFFPQERYN